MSSVKIKAAVVRLLCNDWLDYRDAMVAKKREVMIERAMKRRLFGLLRPRTREEAIHHLENDQNIWSKYHMADMLWSYDWAKVTDLLATANLVTFDQTVTIDSDVASELYAVQKILGKR